MPEASTLTLTINDEIVGETPINGDRSRSRRSSSTFPKG